MSLNAWEEDALNSIRDDLATSAPELASRLLVFNRLTRGEQMPENLRAKEEGRHEYRLARPRRRVRSGRAKQPGGAACATGPGERFLMCAADKRAWRLSVSVFAVLVVTIAIVISLAVVLGAPGHTSGHSRTPGGCVPAFTMTCAG
ncbi:MAG: hypothetical protein J2P28_15070 [Actinobacteria bacterium]|nr:hypothetical protein [Actinomycetota bacterium]